MRNLCLFISCALLFVFGCETPNAATFRTPILDGDAGNTDIPASWEGDWTWEEDDIALDLGVVYHDTPQDAGTQEAPMQNCVSGTRLDGQMRVSVSSGLIPNCMQGHIIHLWGPQGEEYLSEPDHTLTVSVNDPWQGWVAFTVTCGDSWESVIDWSTVEDSDLVGRGLLAVTSDGVDLTPYIRLCPSAVDSTILQPRIPLTCGFEPC